ncbi:hypothetical protein H671_8g19505 [Cricetulus griseus]|nr:hypothetical protein H671_8g19505 [Cricetulus griseus]
MSPRFIQRLDYGGETLCPGILVWLLDRELLGSPASGLVLNYATGFLVPQLVDSRGQLHDQFMEGFADLCIAPSCEMKIIKHVVAGDGTVRVHEAPICIQELHIGKIRQGNFEKLVDLGIPWHSFVLKGWAFHLEVTDPAQ